MEPRPVWHQFQVYTPFPWTVVWLRVFLQLAVIGSLTGLFTRPFSSCHASVFVPHALTCSTTTTPPLCYSDTSHVIRRYTSKQILAIRPAPLDPSLAPHLRDLGIGFHLKKRRSTRGGKRKQRKIKVVTFSNRSTDLSSPFLDDFTADSEVGAAFQRPRSRQASRNLLPVSLSTNKQKVDNASKSLRVGTFNAQSLGPTVQHKRVAVAEFIKDESIDILFIQETWFREKGSEPMIAEIAPAGYTAKSFPRSNFGGGLAFIFRDSLSDHIGFSTDFCFTHTTFELCQLSLHINSQIINFFNIYRTCPSKKNKLTARTFFSEFHDFLDFINTLKNPTIILGDMNFHFDKIDNPHVSEVISLLDSCSFVQLVNESTHVKGHILDWLMCRIEDDLILSTHVSEQLSSDHFTVVSDLNIKCPTASSKFRETRKVSAINRDDFRRDISADITIASCPTAEAFDTALVAALDKHAPRVEQRIRTQKNDPWFPDVKEELEEAKRKRRQAERKKAKNKGITIFQQIYSQAKNFVTSIVVKAKTSFYSSEISNCSNSKQIFDISNKILGKSQNSPLPTHIPISQLPNSFCEFFISKVSKIRSDLDDLSLGTLSADTVTPCSHVFDHFIPVSEEDVRKTILSSKPTTCPLDPIPTPLLISNLDILLPIITNFINDSLVSGIFPDIFKTAVVRPLLKKSNLDRNNLKNYRPVSNLSFLSKIIEKLVLQQIFGYLNSNQLLPQNQSAYRPNHSTESALLKVTDDILLALDKGDVTVLTLLDLSAAFDTVDHKILFSTLQSHFGIFGTALSWFRSYLTNRSQSVFINDLKSDSQILHFGVPQGSVLGPILFLLYTKPLLASIDSKNIQNQSFADDTQLYRSSKPCDVTNSIDEIQSCITDIRQWMGENKLKLNDDKTEAILFHTNKSFSDNSKPDSIVVGNSSIYFSPSARNLGYIITQDMSLDAHISHICRTAYIAIRQISSIRHYLSLHATKILVCSFVLSRLDYCNSLLSGCTQHNINKLQKVQNSAARLVTRTRKRDHITPILQSLHWLPIHARIEYKISLLCHNFFTSSAPHYLSSCLSIYSPARNLRSASDSRILVKPSVRTKSFGQRSFSFSAPLIWNALPREIRYIDNTPSFKRALKTHLFRKCYDTVN